MAGPLSVMEQRKKMRWLPGRVSFSLLFIESCRAIRHITARLSARQRNQSRLSTLLSGPSAILFIYLNIKVLHVVCMPDYFSKSMWIYQLR